MNTFSFTQDNQVDPATFGIELVERKGVGHPDTLADAVAEETSRRYARYCQERFGAIAHHWFDKVMILGGEADTDFSKGNIVRPSHAILAGKAVLRVGNESIPLQEIFEGAVSNVLGRVLKNFCFEKHCVCEVRVRDSVGPGQRSIRYQPKSVSEIMEFETTHLVSNDCNLCVGFAPYTTTEGLVLEVERFMMSDAQQHARPWLGSDIKTVATRQETGTHLLVNVPMLASHVSDFATYQQMRASLEQELQAHCSKRLDSQCDVTVNPEWIHGRAYLTATGTCLDTGDIGVVGRGNRHSGLITPMRSMSIEAAAGKNPIDHTGKLLNVAATWIAESIHNELNVPCTTYIFAKKGDRLEAPSLVAVRCDSSVELPANCEVLTKDIAIRTFAQLHRIREALLLGTARLY